MRAGRRVVALVLAAMALGQAASVEANLPEKRLAAPGRTRRLASLERRLAERSQEAGSVDAIVVLRRQPDFRTRLASAGPPPDPRVRRAALVSELREFAASRQAAVASALATLQAEGHVSSWTPLSILNGFAVAASPEGLRRLVALPDVADAWFDQREGIFWGAAPASGRDDSGATRIAERFLAGPREIGAPALWARGIDGSGMLVGLLDTGVDASHEQLGPTWLGGSSGWFDPTGASATPRDPTGHGTAVASAATGANARGIALGSAPGARWTCAAAAPSNTFAIARFMISADWMLRVAQPDVLLLAMARPPGACVREFQPVLDAFRAADTVICVAAGNQGGRASTDTSPANLAHVDGSPVLSVGATFRDGLLYPLGALGPSSCTGRLFPQVVAPGMRVAAASSGDPTGLVITDGTSLAVAFVAGGAALLRQAHPHATARDVEDAIRRSARDLGPPGPDNMFGFGAVDLPAALAELASQDATRPQPRARPGR